MTINYMDVHRQISRAGIKIMNPDGPIQESISYRYPGEKFTSCETAKLTGNIACVLGDFMIARKELIEELGGFDGDFFLYGEYEDLAWRIRKKVFSIGYIEDAKVCHWGGQGENLTPKPALFEI